jgi:polyferredoxin
MELKKMQINWRVLFIVGFTIISLLGSVSNGFSAPYSQEQAPDCHSTDDLSRGNIREFKDNYIPKEFFPTPEYMVFVDLGVLVLLLLIGVFFVWKKKSQKAMTIMAIITFAYLGFIRGGCVCPVGAISNTTMGLVSPAEVGLASLIIFMVPLIIALIIGRVFCTSGCPLGAVQHIVQKSKKTIKLPKKLNNALKIVPILMLIATVYFAIQSACFFVCEVEPYKVLFFTGQIWFEQALAFIIGHPMEPKFLIAFGIGTWLYLIAILVLGYWVPRPFCRFLCPYGVLLGVVSFFSFKQRKIKDHNCVYCGMCEKTCPTQAIVIDRKNRYSYVSNYDCVQCNKCNDVCKKDAF